MPGVLVVSPFCPWLRRGTVGFLPSILVPRELPVPGVGGCDCQAGYGVAIPLMCVPHLWEKVLVTELM